MAKAKKDRFATCTEVLNAARTALSPAVGGAFLPPPPPIPSSGTVDPGHSLTATRAAESPAPRGRRRAPLLVGGAILLVIAIVAALLVARGGQGGGNLPDPRAVPVSTLLRVGTSAQRVLYGNLDGRPPDEIALWSASNQHGNFSSTGQNFVDVFANQGGTFKKIFDATAFTAPGFTAPLITSETDPSQVSQFVSSFKLVDFQNDGTPELVIGVQFFGRTWGPLTCGSSPTPGAACAWSISRRRRRTGS